MAFREELRYRLRRLGEFLCGLKGHTTVPRYEKTRLSLQCSNCGYESPGWELATRP